MLAEFGATLLVGLVKWYYQEQQRRAAIFAEVERQQAHDAFTALGWKEQAMGTPDGGAALRVRDGAGAIVSGPDTRPASDPPGGNVSDR